MSGINWDLQFELLSKANSLALGLKSTLREAVILRYDTAKPSRISALEEKLRASLQALDEARNWTLSPIFRLPDDLVRYIFLHSYDVSDKVKFPRLIASTCRHWRAVALDTANLWRLLRFPTGLTLPDRTEPWHPWYNLISDYDEFLQPLFATNLQRSREGLLDAELRLTLNSGSQQAVRTFLDICGDRTSDLFITVSPSATTMSQLGECVSAVSKTLRRFSVYFLYTEILEAYRDAMNVLLRVPMPELTDVTLHELPIPTALGQSYVLLSACRILNLSLYQFDWITKEDLHGLLQSAGQLVKLLLTVPMQARQDFTKRQEDTRLIMPNLREYTVNFSPYRAHANSTLAFSFTAPSLETLRIHVYGSIPTDEARATICRMFEGFIHASAPRRLTTLHLRQGAVQAATRVLPLLPSLTTLHLSIDVHLVAVSGEQHALWRTVLARLDEGPEEMVCPALETLFTGTWAFSSHLRLLQRVAQTRRQGGRQIRRLALAEWPSQTAETALSELPSSASQAYELEAALADEVGELMIGEWRFDKEKRTWEKRSGGGEDAEEETFPM